VGADAVTFAVMKSDATTVPPFNMNSALVMLAPAGSVRLSSVTFVTAPGTAVVNGLGVVETPLDVTQNTEPLTMSAQYQSSGVVQVDGP
jgi:hypothetical protein